MSRGVNKVILVGNLGSDPDLKYTQGGTAICTISLATSEKFKDRDGETQEKVAWHRVKLWGKLGEIAGEYLAKGRQVYIEGKLEYGSYEKDGVKHYTTDIIASEMQMLGGGGEGGHREEREPRRESRSAPPARGRGQPSGNQRRSAPARQEPQQSDFADDFADDDIPFNHGEPRP